MGINLGRFTAHYGNVHLILNPRTSHVYPQFHCVFEDGYLTVPSLISCNVSVFWKGLVNNNIFLYTDEEFALVYTWDLPTNISTPTETNSYQIKYHRFYLTTTVTPPYSDDISDPQYDVSPTDLL